jgi:hypothetical protein
MLEQAAPLVLVLVHAPSHRPTGPHRRPSPLRLPLLSFGLFASLALFLFFSPLPIASFLSVDHCDLSYKTACKRACHSFFGVACQALSHSFFCVLLLRISSNSHSLSLPAQLASHSLPAFLVSWTNVDRQSYLTTTLSFAGFWKEKSYQIGREQNKTKQNKKQHPHINGDRYITSTLISNVIYNNSLFSFALLPSK